MKNPPKGGFFLSLQALDHLASPQDVEDLLDPLLHRQLFGIQYQIGVFGRIVGKGDARDIVATGGVESLGIPLGASRWRSLDVYRQQALGTDQCLSLGPTPSVSGWSA